MFEGLFQPMHLLVIFGIALLVLGPKKLPELGKGIGEGRFQVSHEGRGREAGRCNRKRSRPIRVLRSRSASFKVANTVTSFKGYGMGSYSFFNRA